MSGGIFLVRVAGLPADALEIDPVGRVRGALDDLEQIERTLEGARSELVETLFQRVPCLSAELRPLALQAKRHCHNGRPIHALSYDPRWPALHLILREEIAAVLALEQSWSTAEARLLAVHDEEREREATMARNALQAPGILHAVALASRDLAAGLRKTDPGSPIRRSKKRRGDISALRYLNRATTKLSPFSSLTRIGLGVVHEEVIPHQIELVDHPWRSHSLLRARRSLMDGVAELLIRVPAVQQGLSVVLNDTLREQAPGVFQLVRPMQFSRDRDTGELRWTKASVVMVKVEGAIPRALLQELGGGSRRYEELAGVLATGLRSTGEIAVELHEEIAAALDGLLSIGFLRLEPPWSGHRVHLEKAMLNHLESLSWSPALEPLVNCLRRLLAAEESYMSSGEPLQAVCSMDELLAELTVAAYELHAMSPPPRKPIDVRYNLYHDVFISPVSPQSAAHEESGDGLPVALLSQAAADEIMDATDVLWRLMNFFHPRWNFLHALSALIEEHWGARESVPVDLIEVFVAARELMRQFAAWGALSSADPFNPYGSKAIQHLENARGEMRAAIRRSIGDEGVSQVAALRSLLAVIPESYDPIVGACAFVQPADVSGGLWVLNRIFEGTGRFGSRFTGSMPERTQQDYIAACTAASRIAANGEDVEILDILYARETTVNIHLPQTPRVLTVPGEYAGLGREREVRLSELRLFLEGPLRLPVVRDLEGRRCLPCHLTPVNDAQMPVLAKFLALFGPSSGIVEAIPANIQVRREGKMTMASRLTLGNLVFRRKRWVFSSDDVPWQAPSGAQTLAAISQWFAAVHLPSRFYVIESVRRPGSEREVYKPQFVSLESPLSCELFGEILAREPLITIEEALPLPEDYPRDESGRRWGVEMMLDSLLLNTVRCPSKSGESQSRLSQQ